MHNVIRKVNVGHIETQHIKGRTMIKLTYEEAIKNIEQLVKADPFNNAIYQRLAVYAKSYIVAQTKNPSFCNVCRSKAMKLIVDNNLQYTDATGSIDAIINTVNS